MKNKNLKYTKRKRGWFSTFMIWVCLAILEILVLTLGFVLLTDWDLVTIYTDLYFWLAFGVVFGITLVIFLFMWKIDPSEVVLDEAALEDTHWLTSKDLKKMHEFDVCKYSEMGKHPDGIVIGAEKKKDEVELTLTSNLHALIVGTTGSGKTTGFVDQNIAALAESKTKPSLVISDPKKELYEKHAAHLEKNGYNIVMLDLRDPYSSERWNPMNVLTRRIKLIKEFEGQQEHEGRTYEVAGETFTKYSDIKTRVQGLKDEMFENAMDLVYTLCPIQNKEQPNWETGARNLILGFVVAMCEDCIAGKIDEKQMCLFNVYHNITRYCSEDTTELKEYLLEGRDQFSKVRGLVNTVLITSDKTLTSYLSEVNSYMQQLSDDAILSLTSENEIDIMSMDEKPTAVYIIVPDERATRHRFVTLFVTQLYKELVEKANLNSKRKETKDVTLKRNTYFILDEFGNLPKFESIDNMVTVARSRGIRFLFVLQSFTQLTSRYGKEIGDVIKTNCNVKIFIGSDDPDTRKEFSDLCGQKKIKSMSVSTNDTQNASTSTGAQNQPLITVGMLERLNGDEKGDAIVSVRGYEPIWSVFTPSYELQNVYFRDGRALIADKEQRLFNKEEYLFDICGQEAMAGRPHRVSQEELDEFEYREQQMYANENEREVERINELTSQWDKIRDDIDKQLVKLCQMLSEEDASYLMAARLEDKVAILSSMEDNYDATTQKHISRLESWLDCTALPQLRRIQEMV